MDVDKILITDDQEYFLSKDSLILAERKIKKHYSTHSDENLVIQEGEGSPKFQVFFSKGEGIIVSELKEVEGGIVNGISVTFRKQGDIRIDDPNLTKIAPGGILHTYYGVCDQEGTVTFYTNNDKQSNPSHVNHLLNVNHYRGLNTKEIADRYRAATTTAIGVLKKLPQS